MMERVRRELRGYIYKCFQGNLASHLGGMFSSESQVISQPLASEAIWKVQMGKQALGLLITASWGARAAGWERSDWRRRRQPLGRQTLHLFPGLPLHGQRGLFGRLA